MPVLAICVSFRASSLIGSKDDGTAVGKGGSKKVVEGNGNLIKNKNCSQLCLRLLNNNVDLKIMKKKLKQICFNFILIYHEIIYDSVV